MDKQLIDELVDRFLTWPLPISVHVDPCARPETKPYPFERTGTNLLTAGEARQMIKHLLAIIPANGTMTCTEANEFCDLLDIQNTIIAIADPTDYETGGEKTVETCRQIAFECIERNHL